MRSIKAALFIVVCLFVGQWMYAQKAMAVGTMQNDSESIILPGEYVNPTPALNEDGQTFGFGTDGGLIILPPPISGTSTATTTQGTLTVTVGKNNEDTNPLLEDLFLHNGITITDTNTPGGTGQGTTIVLNAAAIRAALAGQGISNFRVRGWDLVKADYAYEDALFAQESRLGSRDVAVIAAAAIFRDQHIESVTISGTSLSIAYKTEGWLLWFIPITFSVTININSSAENPQDRVMVHYPWYRYITWVKLSPQELAADINAAIVGNVAAGISPEEAQAKLFTQVTNVLIGTQAAVGGAVEQI